MSKSELNEEQGLSGTKDSGPSRRRFIRNIAIGTAGAAFAMSNLDRLRGASKLLERLTDAHVEGFMDHIKDVTESPQARQEFQRISTLVLQAVDGDPKSRETYNAIKHYLANPVVPVPEGVKGSDVDMVMGAGYLRAIEGIQHTTRHVSADDVKKRLQNPKAMLHIFESGFLNQLYAKTKGESASNPGFAQKLADASREARGTLLRGKEARLVPASFFQCASNECTIDIGQGPTCQPWEICVGVVVILVVVFLIIK